MDPQEVSTTHPASPAGLQGQEERQPAGDSLKGGVSPCFLCPNPSGSSFVSRSPCTWWLLQSPSALGAGASGGASRATLRMPSWSVSQQLTKRHKIWWDMACWRPGPRFMVGRTREVSRLLAVAEGRERGIVKPTQGAPKGMWVVIKKTPSHGKVRKGLKKKQGLSYLQKHRQEPLHSPQQCCGPSLHPMACSLPSLPRPLMGRGGLKRLAALPP